MDPLPETQASQQAQAHQDLEDIAELKRSKAFTRYFMAEPVRRIEEIEKTLRKRALSETDRQFHLGELAVLERWRDKLDEDRATNASIAEG
jgi:hypothetical protein